MLRRYSCVPDLPAEDGIRLILFALEKETDDKLFALWVGSNQCSQQSFNEFKESLKPARFDENVLDRIDQLMESTTWTKG